MQQLAQIEQALNAERFELFLQPILPLHDARRNGALRGAAAAAHAGRWAVRAGRVPGRRGASKSHAGGRSLGGAHAARVAGEQPRSVDAGAIGVLHQSGLAIDDGRELHQLRRILRAEERAAAAGAVLRDHRTLRRLGRHQRRGVDEAPRSAGMRGCARRFRRERALVRLPAHRTGALLQDRRLAGGGGTDRPHRARGDLLHRAHGERSRRADGGRIGRIGY